MHRSLAVAGVVLAGAFSLAASGCTSSGSRSNANALLLKARLMAVPAGTVAVSTNSTTHQIISTVSLFGLIPRFDYGALLAQGSCTAPGPVIVSFPNARSDPSGLIKTQLTASTPNPLPAQAHFAVVAAGSAASPQSKSFACGDLSAASPTTTLQGNESNAAGTLSMAYDGSGTLKINLVATGLPASSTHAFHVHFGSCGQQSGVLYNFGDVVADSVGTVRFTTTVRNLKAPPPKAEWYADLHAAASNALETGGSPSAGFQPLLCGDGSAVTAKP